MRKPDDCSLTPHQRERIRFEAERALSRADAIGRFPTPISDVMSAAKVLEVEEDVLSSNFLAKLRRKAGTSLKRALGKVIGVFDAVGRLVFIDRTLVAVRQAFVKLHETAHGALPWQRDLYALVEDNEQSISPEIAELFDREANAFASEVLFQLDAFSREAEEHTFGILVPVNLSKKYGASIYATVRRYVSNNYRACAVLVLDPPIPCDGDGFRCNLRRVVASDRYAELFGNAEWPGQFTPSDAIGAMVPLGKRRMSGKRSLGLKDRTGGRHECLAEAFTQKHQVFILIHASESLRPAIVAVGNKSA